MASIDDILPKLSAMPEHVQHFYQSAPQCARRSEPPHWRPSMDDDEWMRCTQEPWPCRPLISGRGVAIEMKYDTLRVHVDGGSGEHVLVMLDGVQLHGPAAEMTLHIQHY